MSVEKPPRQQKSIWRLVGGTLLVAGAAHNLTHRPVGQTHDVFVWYFGINVLLAAVGFWLAIRFFR
jgi:hypothetical protein